MNVPLFRHIPKYECMFHPIYFFKVLPRKGHFFFGRALRDLSSPTRDWTQATAVKALNPNHWTAREFPRKDRFFTQSCLDWVFGAQRNGLFVWRGTMLHSRRRKDWEGLMKLLVAQTWRDCPWFETYFRICSFLKTGCFGDVYLS